MLKRPFLLISGTVIGTVGVLSYVPRTTTATLLLPLSPTTQSATAQSATAQSAPTQTSTAPTQVAPAPTGTSGQSTAKSEKKKTTKATATTKAKAKAHATTPIQTPTQTPTATATPVTSTRTIAGSIFQTPFGPVQVQITVQGRKIINAAALQTPQGGRSSWINQQAVPYLIQETLAAQSANIQGVGGATYTSEGWAQSLQAALAQI